MNFETVIGLEVHAQLLTSSKIFCGCSTQFGAEPNTQTCPVCLGMPGVLPVTNRKAIELVIRMGLAVHCRINETSLFARKNYFYPDLPKGYQISQYEEPLAEHGWIEIDDESGETKKIRIRRIHIEEDAGKSVHAEQYVREDESMMDFNRCGVPLMEIVSEPDLRSPREAHQYLTRLRQIVRWLDVCDGNMEEGSLRCDANISLRPRNTETMGVKTELKNMNSIRNVEKALMFEVSRQEEILNRGERVKQQTLLWDVNEGAAFPMRSKEEAHDYRYFPDPDLIPVAVPETWQDRIQKTLPELPGERMARWIREFGIPEYDASVLSEDRGVADYFETLVAAGHDPKQASNWVMGEVLRYLNETKNNIRTFPVKTTDLGMILDMIRNGNISNSAGKKVFEKVLLTGMSPDTVVEKMGLRQVSDVSSLDTVVDKVLTDHAKEVEKYLSGHDKVFGFLMGQIMKESKGQANPRKVSERLRAKLDGSG